MVADKTLEIAKARLPIITGGEVETPTQTARILKWLESHKLKLPNLRAATVDEILEGDKVSGDVREVLQIRRNTGKASTKKLQGMLDRMDSDGRVRGSLMYHGASTGRWAGAGMQPHNFPRGTISFEDTQRTLRLLKYQSPEALDLVIAPPLDCLSSSLRAFIRADKGKRFLVSDFASIEARVLAWLAGQESLLVQFRNGEDIYKSMAADIYGKSVEDVEKSERQMGKTAILGLGYGMGPGNRRSSGFVGAVKAMAGIDIKRSFSRQVVAAYRKKYPAIPALWGLVNGATIRAVESGTPQRAGMVTCHLGDDVLKIRLPSGRDLHYHKPEVREVVAPWTEGEFRDAKNPRG